MPKTGTENHSSGTTTVTTEIDGVRSTVTKPLIANVYKGDLLAKTAYKQHKVWNPNTNAFLTVTMTGNEAQDASLLAAAFVTAGVTNSNLISTT